MANIEAGRDLPQIEGYEVFEEIDRGGMGVVYRALQSSTRRIVALKVLLTGSLGGSSARHRFQRELKLAARLDHPNIVRMFTGGSTGGRPYFAMEHVEGTRLDCYLAKEQPRKRKLLEIFVKICEAIEYAHRQGVVHRDLKPSNIIIGEDGEPHILDFGLAKAIGRTADQSSSTRISFTGQVVGTLAYMSPEQALGQSESIDARSDIFTLGIILYRSLTGSLPFPTDGPMAEVIYHIVGRPPVAPASLSHSVDSELETIILKALEKAKEDRYQTAGELGSELRRYLAGEPILARRPSRLYLLRKRLARYRAVIAMVALVMILSAAIGSYRALLYNRAQTEARRYVLFHQYVSEEFGGPTELLVRGIATRFPELREPRLVALRLLFRSGRGAGFREAEAALQLDPSLWECRELLAEFHLHAGETEKAARLSIENQENIDDTAETWYIRSLTTLDDELARTRVRQALALDPKHLLAWDRLTYLQISAREYEKALQSIEKILDLGGTSTLWIQMKIEILARLDRTDEALQQVNLWSKLEPENSNPFRYQALFLRWRHQYHQAVDAYSSAIKADGREKGYAWDYYQRAGPLWILGRYDEALSDYQQFRLLHPQIHFSEARRYLILMELDHQAEAEQILTEALEASTNEWLALVLRCLAGELTPEELVAAAETGNREQLCEACYYAGEVCLQLGRLETARKWFEQAYESGLRYDPNAFPLTPMNEHDLAGWRLRSLSERYASSGRPLTSAQSAR